MSSTASGDGRSAPQSSARDPGSLAASDPRRWTDDVFEADLSYEQVDAFVLGREVRRFADERDRQLIAAFIARVRDEEDAYSTQLRMARRGHSQRQVTELLERIRGLELGLG